MTTYAWNTFEDLAQAAKLWRVWIMLGLMDILKRYRRSKIGPFWITISMAALVAGLGVVYSGIFAMSMREYLPYVAINFVIWALINALVNEGCLAFVDAESYIKQQNLPKSTFVLRLVVRNLLMTAHNFLIVPVVLIFFEVPITPAIVFIVPALILIVLNGLWVGLLLGTLSARFRDFPQMVQSIMQVVFFMTPVVFQTKQLGSGVQSILVYSPFAASLAIARDPLLGHWPSTQDLTVVLLTLCVGWLIVIPFFGKFRDRIVYWL